MTAERSGATTLDVAERLLLLKREPTAARGEESGTVPARDVGHAEAWPFHGVGSGTLEEIERAPGGRYVGARDVVISERGADATVAEERLEDAEIVPASSRCVARHLGIARRTLMKKMDDFGIPRPGRKT